MVGQQGDGCDGVHSMNQDSKISPKLSSLIASKPPRTGVRLSVILDAAIPSGATASVAQELTAAVQTTGSPLVLPASRMILIDATLGAVEQLARQPHVVWVDANTEARIEDLLDAE